VLFFYGVFLIRRRYTKKDLPSSWITGFDAAKKEMLSSPENDKNTFNVGAALFSGNRIISVGHNVYEKTHPMYLDVNEREEEFARNTHAELMALSRRKHYSNNKNLIMYVYREAKNKEPAISEPCPICKKMLKEFGVAKVRYVNEYGEFEEQKPKEW
jgi:deoxycytidylate deaminase